MNIPGWVKLHRQFLEWEWYDDINVKTLFLHFLLKANYEAKKYRGYDILPGQVVVGVKALSKQTGLSVSQVRTAIDKLQMTNEIAIKTTNKFSIVTIVCWNVYQGDDNQNRDQIANGSQSNRNQIATPKEGKKEKKVRRKEEYIGDCPEFENWYSIYPRKISPKKAKQSYEAAIRSGVSHEDLLKGLTQYCEDIKRNGTETRFIKHPATWLNQGCYYDDHSEIVHDDAGRKNKRNRSFLEIAAEVTADMGKRGLA